MVTGFLDFNTELALWLNVSGLFLIFTLILIRKYRRIGEEAKPFIFGIILFLMTFLIARTIETIRRHFVSGDYYDIVNSNFQIEGINLILRLSYYIIAWTGITIFYFVFERYIMKEGMKKNTRYFLTICSALEGSFSCLLYFTANAIWVQAIVFILFFGVAFFPILFFSYVAVKSLTRRQRIAWFLNTIGLFLFIAGVMIDLPEAAMITQTMPLELVHFVPPILQAIGVLAMGIGFLAIYQEL
ncbi:MAG: hypothetical protein ACTSRS_15290 [Candidatus Helarchaeota archaeon]